MMTATTPCNWTTAPILATSAPSKTLPLSPTLIKRHQCHHQRFQVIDHEDEDLPLPQSVAFVVASAPANAAPQLKKKSRPTQSGQLSLFWHRHLCLLHCSIHRYGPHQPQRRRKAGLALPICWHHRRHVLLSLAALLALASGQMLSATKPTMAANGSALTCCSV